MDRAELFLIATAKNAQGQFWRDFLPFPWREWYYAYVCPPLLFSPTFPHLPIFLNGHTSDPFAMLSQANRGGSGEREKSMKDQELERLTKQQQRIEASILSERTRYQQAQQRYQEILRLQQEHQPFIEQYKQVAGLAEERAELEDYLQAHEEHLRKTGQMPSEHFREVQNRLALVKSMQGRMPLLHAHYVDHQCLEAERVDLAKYLEREDPFSAHPSNANITRAYQQLEDLRRRASQYAQTSNWQGTKREIEPSAPDLSRLAIKPVFPQIPGAGQQDWQRLQEEQQALEEKIKAHGSRFAAHFNIRAAQQRSAQIAERQQLYHFYASVKATEAIAHGKELIPAALTVPQHFQDLARGNLSIPHIARAQQIVDEVESPFVLETRLSHLLQTSGASTNGPLPALGATSKAIQPPTLAEYQAKLAASKPSRDELIDRLAERLFQLQDRTTIIPEERLSYHEMRRSIVKRLGNASHEQLAAITSNAPVRVVKGGPGTGKTRTGVTMIERLAAEKGVPLTGLFYTSPTHAGIHALRQGVKQLMPYHPDIDFDRDLQFRTLAGKALSDLATRPYEYHVDQETGEEREVRGISPIERLLGTSRISLLGGGRIPINNAQTVEAALARAGEMDQRRYIEEIIRDFGLKAHGVNANKLMTHINTIKNNEADAAFQARLARGEKLWKDKNTASRSDLDAGLYAYQQSLAMAPGFGGRNQREPMIDLADIMRLWVQAGRAEMTPQFQHGVVVDEYQELSRMAAAGLFLHTMPDTPMIFLGDMGQKIMGSEGIDQVISALFGQHPGRFEEHTLSGNYRSPAYVVSQTNAVNQLPALRESGTSPLQVAASGRMGTPPEYLLGSTFEATHFKVFKHLFNRIGVTPEMIQHNLRTGRSPFAGSTMPMIDAPIIVNLNEEREDPIHRHDLLSNLERYLQTQGLSQQEAALAIQQGVSTATPGTAGSTPDLLHIISTQQARSQEFPHPYVSVTPGGLWSPADWQRLLNTALSRATEQNTVFATSSHFRYSSSDNRFDEMAGGRLLPAGFRPIEEGMYHSMVHTHGMPFRALPEEIRGFDAPSLEQMAPLTSQQQAALARFLGTLIDFNNAVPMIRRNPTPTEGSGLLQMRDQELLIPREELGEGEDSGNGKMPGFQIFGGSLTAAAKGEYGLTPDTRLFAMAARYAEQKLLTGEGGLPTDNIAEFLRQAKPLMGRISKEAYRGRTDLPGIWEEPVMLPASSVIDEHDMPEKDWGERESIEENWGQKGKILLNDLIPRGMWSDVGYAQQTLNRFLKRDEVKNNPDLQKALALTAERADSVMRAGGQYLDRTHLETIQNLAQKLANSTQMHFPDREEDRNIRTHFNTVARIAEAFRGNDPEYGEQTQITAREFKSIRRSNPRLAQVLWRLFGNKEQSEATRALQFHPMASTEAQRNIYRLLNQVQYASLRATANPKQARALGVPRGFAKATPWMAEMVAHAQSLEHGGVLDPHNVQTIPANPEIGQPEQTFQLRGTVPLVSLQQRLREMETLPVRTSEGERGLSPDARMQIRQQRRNVEEIRRNAHDPRRQQAWGHALNIIFSLATGRNALNDNGTANISEFNRFMAPTKELGQTGQRTLEHVMEMHRALDAASKHIRETGRVKREHVNRVLAAFQHSPDHPMFVGLQTLSRLGFARPSDELPLYSISDPKNLVNLVAESPERREALLEQYTRSPLLIGQRYIFRGGQEGFAPIAKGQRAILRAMGAKAHQGLGVAGYLQPWSDNPDQRIGGTAPASHYGSEQLLTPEEYQVTSSPDFDPDTPHSPLYRLDAGGYSLPVRADQLSDPLDLPFESYTIPGAQPTQKRPVSLVPSQDQMVRIAPKWRNRWQVPPRSRLSTKQKEEIARAKAVLANQGPHLVQGYLWNNQSEGITVRAQRPDYGQVAPTKGTQSSLGEHNPLADLEREKADLKAYVNGHLRYYQRSGKKPSQEFIQAWQRLKQIRALEQQHIQALPTQRAQEYETQFDPRMGAYTGLVDMRGMGYSTFLKEMPDAFRPTKEHTRRELYSEHMALQARGFAMQPTLWSDAEMRGETRPGRTHPFYAPAPTRRGQLLLPAPKGSSSPTDVGEDDPFGGLRMPPELRALLLHPTDEQADWLSGRLAKHAARITGRASVQEPPADQLVTPDVQQVQAAAETVQQQRAHVAQMAQRRIVSPGEAGGEIPPPEVFTPPPQLHDQRADLAAWIDQGLPGNKYFPPPSAEQQAVYHTTARNVALQGGAGTGKTSTLMNTMGYLATRGNILPRNITMVSYMHSGVDVLNERQKRLAAYLPQRNPNYQFQPARTIFSLANQILTKDAEPDEHGVMRYPALEDQGFQWSGRTIHALTDEDKRRLSPAEQRTVIQPAAYLRRILDPKMKEWGQKPISDYRIGEFAKDIEQIKSGRINDPYDAYSQGMRLGREDLAHQRMTKHAALVLQEEHMRKHGDMDFSDQLHYASEALEKKGIRAVPSELQGTQAVWVDEAQDNVLAGTRFIGNYAKALAENNPRVFLSYDPMQTLIAERFGGINQNEIEKTYGQYAGDFSHFDLTENRRSPRSTVSLMNSILRDPQMASIARSLPQKAMRPELGVMPQIKTAPHQIALYDQMFDDMLANAGISWKQMAENVANNRHPFANIPFQQKNPDTGKWEGKGQLPPGRSATIFAQWRDRDLFRERQEVRIQKRLGVPAHRAKQIGEQIFRDRPPGPNAIQAEKDKARLQFAISLASRFRSLDESRIYQDISRTGGGDEVDAQKRFYIGISREDEIGRSALYATRHPFTHEDLRRYRRNPNSLQMTPEGQWQLGTYAGSNDPYLLLPDQRNDPDQLGGIELPRGLGEPLRGHFDTMLQEGMSPYSSYFEKRFQPYLLQRAQDLGLIPQEAMGKGVHPSVGPRFWTRRDLASYRENLPTHLQKQVAQRLANYPKELAKDYQHDRENNPTKDIQDYLQNEHQYHYERLKHIILPMPQGPERQAGILQTVGSIQYLQHLKKHPDELARTFRQPRPAQPIAAPGNTAPPPAPDPAIVNTPPGGSASQPQPIAAASGGTASPSFTPPPLGATDEEDESMLGPTPSRKNGKVGDAFNQIAQGIRQIFTKQVNISGNGINVSIGSKGQQAPGGSGTGTPPPPPQPGMVWDTKTQRLVPPAPGGIAGTPVGPTPRGSGGVATAGGSGGSGTGSDKPLGLGFGNPYLQFGRTFARVGDELAYIGQYMQKSADTSLQEGGDYRAATMFIPGQAKGKDGYGFNESTLTAGNNQTSSGGLGQQLLNYTVSGLVKGLLASTNANLPSNILGTIQEFQGKPQNNQQFGLPQLVEGIISGITDKITGKSSPPPATQKGQTKAAGDNGTQGFFDFTDANNPNTIAYLQKNVLPMYSDTQIAQAIKNYLGATNQTFSRTGVQASTDLLGLSAMSGIDVGTLTSQMSAIAGRNQSGFNKNQQISSMYGQMYNLFQGNLTEQNVSPYLNAMENLVPTLAGISGPDVHNTDQANAFFKMALNAGMSASNLPDVSNAVNSLAQIGYSPNLRGQYALAQLYGSQNLTASPEYFQYQQSMLGQNEQLASMQLQQKMQVPQLQIEADNAQINLDQVNLQAQQFSLAQNQASFNFNQWMQTQMYGPIGADSSKTAYFNFQKSQLAAGYNSTSPNNATNYQQAQPFGLKNEEFYAGIENQRSMLVLGRSSLLADAKFQQQMKYLDQQENFYVRELQLMNDQRSFDKTWGQRSLDMQASQLDAEKKSTASQIKMLEYDKANTALQATYLPQQIKLLQQIIINTQQQMNGQGPLNGQSITPAAIMQRIMDYYKNDTSKTKNQDLLNLLRSAGLDPQTAGILAQMVEGNPNASVSQIMAQMANNPNDKQALQALQNAAQQGAYAGQQNSAGSANAALNGGGTGQDWTNLIQAMNQDKDATNALAQALAPTAPLQKHLGDISTGLAPLTTGIGTFTNIIGTIAGIAGGAGGAGGRGGAGAIGGAQGGMGFAMPLPRPGLGVGGPTPVQYASDGPTGDPRNASAKFWETILEDATAMGMKKRNQTKYSHFGLITPTVNADYHDKLWYGQHQGVDFQASQGTPLSEFIGGEVKATGFFPWGGEVDVLIPGGLIERYLHLSQIGVTPGQKIKQGQKIGLTGGGTAASGLGYWSKGAHSHVQIDAGNINNATNPWPIWAAFGLKDLFTFYGNTTLQADSVGKGISKVKAGGGGFLAGMADGGIAMKPIITPLSEKEPEAVIPLSKLKDVLASMNTQSSAGAPSSAGGSTGNGLSMQSLVGQVHLTVNTQSSTMSEAEKDGLMADVLDIFQAAIRQANGKL